MAFEVRVDCPSCAVEGTRIETWVAETPSCRLGLPESVRCRLCGHTADGRVTGAEAAAPGDGCPGCGSALDEAIREAHRCPFCGAHAILVDRLAPRGLTERAALEAALDTWAREEGLGSAHDLVDAYFVLPSLSEVLDAIGRGERVETTFDVADYLFSGGGAGGAAAGEPAVMMRQDDEAPATQRNPLPASLRRIGGPREELLAIASVAAADGEASADDQAVLLRAADKRGMPPLSADDVRVWRPNEIDPPPTLVDRERVLEEMFQMGWADGQMDESELRVIRDYARAWGIDPERLREWTELYSFGDSNVLERWFRRIGLFIFPAK
ncbi:MAG: TerB family tellurite resistance protein [Labilithrix sp.]|nr:TerB family tellurite resistance protein [Labilithrix sp.]